MGGWVEFCEKLHICLLILTEVMVDLIFLNTRSQVMCIQTNVFLVQCVWAYSSAVKTALKVTPLDIKHFYNSFFFFLGGGGFSFGLFSVNNVWKNIKRSYPPPDYGKSTHCHYFLKIPFAGEFKHTQTESLFCCKICFVAICAYFCMMKKISGLVSDLQPVDI